MYLIQQLAPKHYQVPHFIFSGGCPSGSGSTESSGICYWMSTEKKKYSQMDNICKSDSESEAASIIQITDSSVSQAIETIYSNNDLTDE